VTRALPPVSLRLILAVALVASACQPPAPTPSDGSAAALRAELMGAPRPVVGDSATQAQADSEANARSEAYRRAWGAVDTSNLWFEHSRQLDLTGDGTPDQLILRARGTRPDSLIVRLLAVVDGKSITLDAWASEYELIEPPFPRDTVPSVVGEYLRASFRETVDSARLQLDSLTPQYFDERGSDCGLDFPGCLRAALGSDSGRINEFQGQLTGRKFHLLSYNYGYETSITVFWFAPLKRFLGIYECC
jgi:hypothetical protein